MSLAALDNVLHRDVMQRRFHGDLAHPLRRNPAVRGHPDHASADRRDQEPLRRPSTSRAMKTPRSRLDEETAAPRVHLHGNGRYALMITNSGGGYSRWKDFDMTRWRSDSTLDPWGSFVYIRDVSSPMRYGRRPTSRSPPAWERLSVRFAADRAEIHRRVSGIETILDVTVASEDDVELRRVKITNRSLRARQLEFTSYVELAMAPHAADKAHPAFAKMFIETECPEPGVLIAHRGSAVSRRHPDLDRAYSGFRASHETRRHSVRDGPRKISRPRQFARKSSRVCALV